MEWESRFHVVRWGSAFGVASAILYTAANVKLRESVGVDPFLVAAVKAVPTVVCLAPVILWFLFSGKPLGRSYAMVPRFAAVALIGQFIGNAAFQVALEHIALAVAVPITLGTLIIGGGVLGSRILGEPVAGRKIVAMAVLIAAVAALAMSKNETTATKTSSTVSTNPSGSTPSIATTVSDAGSESSVRTTSWQPSAARSWFSSSTRRPWLGSFCAMASGLAYSLFGVVMRQTLKDGLSMPATMFLSGSVGMIALWTFSFFWVGTDAIADITVMQWRTMAWAGMFNFAAFVALSAALRFLPVVAVNMINASQVAMATAAGVWLFDEATGPLVWTGIWLTILGLLILAGVFERQFAIRVVSLATGMGKET